MVTVSVVGFGSYCLRLAILPHTHYNCLIVLIWCVIILKTIIQITNKTHALRNLSGHNQSKISLWCVYLAALRLLWNIKIHCLSDSSNSGTIEIRNKHISFMFCTVFHKNKESSINFYFWTENNARTSCSKQRPKTKTKKKYQYFPIEIRMECEHACMQHWCLMALWTIFDCFIAIWRKK